MIKLSDMAEKDSGISSETNQATNNKILYLQNCNILKGEFTILEKLIL